MKKGFTMKVNKYFETTHYYISLNGKKYHKQTNVIVHIDYKGNYIIFTKEHIFIKKYEFVLGKF